jgi:hypothetical protein
MWLRKVPIIFAVFVWFLALYGFAHVLDFHIKSPGKNPTAIVAYAAAWAALTGWMIQALIAVRNSRKQHTMSVLLQTRMSAEFNKNVAIIEKTFPEGSVISYSKANRNKQTLSAVRYVLNYYEFIAVGLRHRDLDETLMRDCICSQMCRFLLRADDVIRKVRDENEFGVASAEKRRIFRTLRSLQKRWQRRIDRQKRWAAFWMRWSCRTKLPVGEARN